MYNVNGPPRGFNVVQDQASYDLVFRDVIVDSALGTSSLGGNMYSYNIGVDSINQIYKAELISASVKFNTSIPATIQNKTLLLSIPELNNRTTVVAGNISGSGSQTNQVFNPSTNQYNPVTSTVSIQGQGSNIVQGEIFCQIPDNNTPLTSASVTSNNTISLLIGPHMYDSIQFYNPPINKLNSFQVMWFDPQANKIPVGSSAGNITSFYFTLRIHYFQKRYNTTSFSTSVFTNTGTGTMDSTFQSR